MKMKKELLIFMLILAAVAGRRGSHSSSHSHGSHSSGHSSGSHSSGSHSSGHSSGSHSSSQGHESHSSIHGHESHNPSEGHESHGSSQGHESHNNGINIHESNQHGNHGSHIVDIHPIGQSHHNSQSIPNIIGYPNSHHHHHHHDQQPDQHHASTTNAPTSTPKPAVEESWLSLLCEKGKLRSMQNNYPRERVASAVRELRSVLSSSVGSDARLTIKSEVEDYLRTLNKPALDYEAPSSSEGCDAFTSYIAPLGGCDTSNNALIIVNVPDLQQVIKSRNCRNQFSFCSYSSAQVCLQSTRTERLLTLPAKEESFDLADFSVTTFKFNNGCQCQNILQNNDWNNIWNSPTP